MRSRIWIPCRSVIARPYARWCVRIADAEPTRARLRDSTHIRRAFASQMRDNGCEEHLCDVAHPTRIRSTIGAAQRNHRAEQCSREDVNDASAIGRREAAPVQGVLDTLSNVFGACGGLDLDECSEVRVRLKGLGSFVGNAGKVGDPVASRSRSD